jgi:TolA-binding protein
MVTNPVEQSQMAPAYYTLGAAYFNQPNYPKAIESFRLFMTKFPAHEKTMEIRMSLGRR